MSTADDYPPSIAAQGGIFAIHGDLDGEQQTEFQEREQFIGLVVGTEEFLLPISAVREIIMLVPITFVPGSPDFIDGVINLRGSILPVINTRKLMGYPRGEQASAARIIIARCDQVTFGLIVDGITYVVALLPSEIENQTLPSKGTGAELIGSISKQGNKIAGILDLTRVLKHVAPALNPADADADEDADEAEALAAA